MTIGSDLIAKAMKQQGVTDFFYIMGAPMMAVETAAMKLGLRGIDVRHEQAGAMAAQAYARLTNKPGFCMAASGPGVTNLLTGTAHAFADCTPVIALGGSAPIATTNRGAFQDIDQLAMFRSSTKWSDRVVHARRLPEYINLAIRQAMTGKPGPVYLDLPGDVLYAEVDESKVEWPEPYDHARRSRPAGSPEDIKRIVELLAAAKQPVIVTGTGIIWSEAQKELAAFVDAAGVPFYTTPQGRGVIPEDHPYCYLTARSTAFRDADLILVVGTRMNYVIGHAAPPRWNASAKIVRVDIDPGEIAASPRRLDVAITGDAKAVLAQLTAAAKGKLSPETFRSWRERLRGQNTSKTAEQEAILANASTPIHPLRLCKEIRDFMDRDSILCVDGQEILNFGRQAIPTFTGSRLNSGAFGTMGVGLPFGLGAKVARPESQVIVLHGDGSFGLNGMEMDTLVRHKLPVLVVISCNGGWTADPKKEKPGRNLGFTRYDRMAEAFGCHGEWVEKPDDIRPALERAMKAIKSGKPALVNVKTDDQARAVTAPFAIYNT
ncbi:MAG TPA: thiamine pyrophosphate-binding protein [Hyphomicrobiaceae bacterium]|nr:thiamine pyrophosphate-binding protein [Hyphomicrobiaceae bacterium]